MNDAPAPQPRAFSAYWLGRVPYERAHALQEALVQKRIGGEIGDTLLFLEHDAVITLGRGADKTHVLLTDEQQSALGVRVVETGRGGDVTFHGPGQLVCYPIIDLRPDRCDVRRYVRDLSEVMIQLARTYGIESGVIPGDSKLIGVWVDHEDPRAFPDDLAEKAGRGEWTAASFAKLGAIGVRLSRWVTMHGFAINVATDLAGFAAIVPCGIKRFGVTSLTDLGAPVESLEATAVRALAAFARVFDATITPRDGEEILALLRGIRAADAQSLTAP